MLNKAISFSIDKHRGQNDLGGDEYILHPIRVMNNVEGEFKKIIAILHDIVEDTDVSLDEIEKEFGIEVKEKIGLLTHKKDMSYDDYIKRISKDLIATEIKIADLKDNLMPARLRKIKARYKNLDRVKKYLKSLDFLKQTLENEQVKNK